MADVEAALEPNSYRVRHLIDNDLGYDYTIPPHQHPGGSYEIELVVEKIAPPSWHLTNPTAAEGESPVNDEGGGWWRKLHRRLGIR